MHSGSGCCQIARNRFGIPALSVQADNGTATLNKVFDLGETFEPTSARWLWTRSKNQLDRLGTGTPTKLYEADHGDFMWAEVGILSMQVNDLLPNWRRKRAFILFGNRRWWFWWQQTCHSCCVKQIGAVVDSSLCHPGFGCTLFRSHAPQHDRADDFICDL